jgi:hypothetical protein
VAVEPVDALREGAMKLHPSPRIEWLADTLPSLTFVRARGETSDAVLATAVWMHLDERERAEAMPAVASLVAPGGRADPVAASRADSAGPAHVRRLRRGDDRSGRARGLACPRQRHHRLGSGAPADVTWTRLAFPQIALSSPRLRAGRT